MLKKGDLLEYRLNIYYNSDKCKLKKLDSEDSCTMRTEDIPPYFETAQKEYQIVIDKINMLG
ncbi:hypothetical protein CE91St65_31200 [[Clostridium] symbiosum]|uniref:Uncharacterized protein n=1 Tax=[Clostridium] symbiosum ATCC 14940 TaxID=411472 RepID=A0ABC9TU21_CLOSY|nr:hypothetical protein CLOSYM_03590 [[Clostridium] symbiosum ATCC 14940]BDF25240.1 hypothetical protein CE91St65_31200 [[Clostridium] symbiosum]BDF30145.1 hypothetical protein CE91St66_31220 [[Clostridium] symbiosum]